MSIGISLTVLGKTFDFYAGGGSGKYRLLAISATVLTIGIELSIKV